MMGESVAQSKGEPSVIYHQIRVSIKPDAPKDQVDTALHYLARLGQELDVVESFCVGRDIGGEFDYGAMYALKDIDAYKTYMLAPLHQETDRAGLPVVDNMISQDLTDDPDPEIGEKIAKIHSDRFASDATLRGLVENLGSYEGSGTE
jgi:hypothetical protein